jgi:O-methyltransferase
MKLPANPIQAAWVAGTRFFWNPASLAQLVKEVPACRPKGPPGFDEAWAQASPYTLLDPWRAASIASLFHEVRELDGDVIECGAYRGGTAIMLALLAKSWGIQKTVFMLDSFQGLPMPRTGVDKFHKAGWLQSDVRMVTQVVAGLGLREAIRIVPGWFSDTLPTLEDKRYCLAHVDGDLYESTVTCLEHLGPRMEASGVVVLDDYHDAGEGVRRAVDEHVTATGEELHLGPIPQAYFRAGVLGKRQRRSVKPSLAELRRNRPYQRMVGEVTRRMAQEARAMERMRAFIR